MKRIFTAVALLSLLLVSGDARAIPAEGTIGPAGTAGSAPLRLGTERQLVTSALAGDYFEATSRGTVYTVETAVAGSAGTATPIGAAGTPLIAVYNPIGSGKQLEVQQVNVSWVTGTPAAGGVLYNGVCGQNITATQNNQGTAGLGPVSRATMSANGSVAKGFVATALTGSTAMVAIGVVPGCAPFGGVAISGAATTASPGWGMSCHDEPKGSIVVQPGCVIAIALAGAGTSPVLAADITYREAAYP